MPLRHAYPPLRGHDATAGCGGYIGPQDAFCQCMATYRSADGQRVVRSSRFEFQFEAGANALSVRPLPPEPRPRRTKMRSRSRDRLLKLSIVTVTIVVIALFSLPWVYLGTTATGDLGAIAIWTAGVEVFILGAAAVVGIIIIVSDN